MALPKRPISLKSNHSNSGKIREWNTKKVADWMKNVNDGLFAKYVSNVIALNIDGTALLNLSQIDMTTKLDITIPNHITTLSAAIERLKKKTRRRNKKDADGKTKPNFDIIDTIPSYKKDTMDGSLTPTHKMPQKQSLHKVKSMPLTYTGNYQQDMKQECNDGDIQRAQTLQTLQYPLSDTTVTLKKQLTQKNAANKKKDKYLYKDLGKKLWPNESSMIVNEGWMKKRGVRRSGFKERWCVLRDNGHLYYFEKRPAVNSNSDLPQGMLDLDIVKSIEYVENEDPNTFNIKTKDRDWIFSAMSGGQLVEWMSALNKTIKAIHE